MKNYTKTTGGGKCLWGWNLSLKYQHILATFIQAINYFEMAVATIPHAHFSDESEDATYEDKTISVDCCCDVVLLFVIIWIFVLFLDTNSTTLLHAMLKCDKQRALLCLRFHSIPLGFSNYNNHVSAVYLRHTHVIHIIHRASTLHTLSAPHMTWLQHVWRNEPLNNVLHLHNLNCCTGKGNS